jgi:hypothetical protein
MRGLPHDGEKAPEERRADRSRSPPTGAAPAGILGIAASVGSPVSLSKQGDPDWLDDQAPRPRRLGEEVRDRGRCGERSSWPRADPRSRLRTGQKPAEPVLAVPPRKTKTPGLRGFRGGRYWARTSDPQLVDSEQRSRQFAGVRPERMVERNQSASEHLTERERTSSVAIVATRIQMSGDGTLAHATSIFPGCRFHAKAVAGRASVKSCAVRPLR